MEFNHEKLEVYQVSIKLLSVIFQIIQAMPPGYAFLTDQLKRASLSIPLNIAEGCGRKGNKEKLQFFNISKGSLSELDAQLEISLRLNFIQDKEYKIMINKLERISSMLQGLINSRKVHLVA